MSGKELGKIVSVKFGLGGYQDAMIGATFQLEAGGFHVGDFWGTWAGERTPSCKWTEADRTKLLGETVMRLNGLMIDAGVSDLSELKGVPVEVIYEGNTLKSWRILTEVI